MKNIKLAMRQADQRTIIKVGDVEVGRDFTVIAGPCSVENEEQMYESARAVKAAGADMLRGGAFKPRTSPYAFQVKILVCCNNNKFLNLLKGLKVKNNKNLVLSMYH